MSSHTRSRAGWLLAALGLAAAGCDDGSSSAPPSAACTPDGVVGLDRGQIVPNVEVLDCSGSPMDLRALCASTAAFFYTFAAW